MAKAGLNGCGVHLVGSVPLGSSEAVFRATAGRGRTMGGPISRW